MRKRPWLVWLLVVIFFTIAGAALWFKIQVDEAPRVPVDPGIPDVPDLPDPDDE